MCLYQGTNYRICTYTFMYKMFLQALSKVLEKLIQYFSSDYMYYLNERYGVFTLIVFANVQIFIVSITIYEVSP